MNQRHNDLFFLCENCKHPVILSKEMELGVLPEVKSIRCHYCEHENWDLEGLKSYAKQSQNYANR